MFFEAEGIVGIVLFAFWVYCILDVIATDAALCRNLPKMAWLLLVLIIPDVGGIAWLLLGRPERAGLRPGDTTYRKPVRRYLGPDDDPRFIGSTTPSRPAIPEPSTPRSLEAATPAADPVDAEQEARRQQLAAREAELKERELAAWEAELARREAEVERREGGGGLYGNGGGRS